MYHEIGNGRNGLYVTVDDFRAQMDYLFTNGYRTITMAKAQELLASGQIPSKTVVLTFDDGYASSYTKAWPIMKEHGFTGTIFVCSSFPGRPDSLTWEEIKSLQAEGVEIGSHSQNHADLKQAGSSVLYAEIVSSKKILEEKLGVPIKSFCYPSGAYNENTPDVVKEAGYTSAVTVVFGQASPQNNIYLLPRVRVPGGITLDKFARNIY